MTKRYLRICCAAIIMILGTVFSSHAAVSAIDRFNPNVDGTVYTVALQADGKILVGGTFSCFGKVNATDSCDPALVRNNIARLNADGSVDAAFNPDANGSVESIVVEPDGEILIGGGFTSIGASARNHIARLDSSGGVTAFNPNANDYVYAIALQPDGKVLIGGAFTMVGAVSHSHIARLNTDGSLDSSMSAGAYTNGNVNTIALQVDGAALIGGAFTQVGTTPQQYIARLNASDCSLDASSFNSTTYAGYAFSAGGVVNSIAVHPDGGVIFGGDFSLTKASSPTISRLARTGFNGALDTVFNPAPNSGVNALAVQADGKVLLAGLFSTVNGQARKFIARVDNTGASDAAMTASPDFNGAVYSMAVQSDGKILTGGTFTCVGGATTCNATTNPDKRQNHIARLYPSGVVEVNFNPNANISGTVHAVAVQPSDGKVVVGGEFTALGGLSRNNLARFNSDGTIDAGFNPDVTGVVYAIAVEAGGKIIIGGSFTAVGGISRSNIARLNTDATGTPDSFNPGITGAAVYALVMQTVTATEYVVVGGAFSQAGGVAHGNIARVKTADGAVDAAFVQSAGSDVYALAVQPSDNKILIGGAFTSIGGVLRNRIARLNTDGSVDSGFDPGTGANSHVYSIALQGIGPDAGKIIIGGLFTTVNSTARAKLARLTSAGALDETFADPLITPPGPPPVSALSVSALAVPPPTDITATVNSVAVDSTDRIVVGGLFSMVGATVRNNIARFSSAGALDAAFDPDAANIDLLPATLVKAIAIQDDGMIVLGGNFTVINTDIYRNHIARVDTDGVNDDSFDSGAVGSVVSVALQPDGSIVAGGTFTYIAGQPRNRLARLNPEGTLDGGFNPDVDGTVNAIAMQTDGKILIGGSFTTVGGGAPNRNNIARLNADGTLDSGFNPDVNGTVNAIAIQTDGKILIGGSFTTVGGGAPNRNNIARLDAATGAVDGLNPNVNGAVNAIAIQTDGKIVIGGSFTTVGSTPVTRSRAARLDSTTGLADGFNPNVNGAVNAIAIQTDGKIVIGGSFTTVGSTPVTRNRAARLDAATGAADAFDPNVDNDVSSIALQTDGKVFLGGSFGSITGTGGEVGITQRYIARVTSTGAVDMGYILAVDNTVSAVVLQEDGKVVIGGTFGTVGGKTRANIARLTNTDAGIQALTVPVDGASVVWTRGQASPEAGRVTFETSDDMAVWSTLGSGTRVAGGWQLTGLALRRNKTFYFRARAYYGGGRFDASGSIAETVRVVHLATKPIVTTGAAISVSPFMVQLNGTVLNGDNTTVEFEYGQAAPFGNSAPYYAMQSPLSSGSLTTVTRYFTDPTVSAPETYHYRVKASNAHYVVAVDDVTFTLTPDASSTHTLVFGSGSDVPKAIPDASGAGVSSLLSVPANACPKIADVRVFVNAEHPALNELTLTLTHTDASGTRNLDILSGPGLPSTGLGCQVSDLDVLFDDGATAVQCTPGTAALNGPFKPAGLLTLFDGMDATGDWTLKAVDAAAGNTGNVVNWGITLTCKSNLTVSTVKAPPAAPGSPLVTSSPAGISCGADCTEDFRPEAAVGLTATATGNLEFDNWASGCTCDYTNCGLDANNKRTLCSLVMTGNKTPEATFVEVAKFSAGPATGMVPLYVTFTDESEHAPSSWSWNFDSTGNTQGTSKLQNPAHSFASEGTYTVSLTVNGNPSFSTTRTIEVTACTDGLDPVRIGGVYYSGTPDPNPIQNAYAAAVTGDTIEAKGIVLNGDLDFSGSTDVVLRGGYICGFGSNPAITEVAGVLTVAGAGSVTVENLILR